MFLHQNLGLFGNGTDLVEMCYDSDRSNHGIMSNMASFFFHIFEVHALDSDGSSDYSLAKNAPGNKLNDDEKHKKVMQFEKALYDIQTRCGSKLDGRITITPGVPPLDLSIVLFEDRIRFKLRVAVSMF